jgi:serine protease Do
MLTPSTRSLRLLLCTTLILCLLPIQSYARRNQDANIERALNSIVIIKAERTIYTKIVLKKHTIPMPKTVRQQGSGVIVDAKNGLIITNNHLVNHVSAIMVTLNNHQTQYAQLIGHDRGTDIALLKIKANHLKQAKIGNSNHLFLGEKVWAIGTPFGFNQSVTAGVIGGLHRSIGRAGFEDFIQFDAPINPGNSGGALLNRRGEVIGINTAIHTISGGNLGLGFAIPIHRVQDIAKQLLKYGTLHHARLGVVIQPITPAIAKAVNYHGHHGVMLSNLSPNSAAEKFGLQVEDILTSVNQEPIMTPNQLASIVSVLAPKTTISLNLVRAGKPMTKKITLGQAPNPKRTSLKINKKLGMSLSFHQQIDEQNHAHQGLLVLAVESHSQAWLHGIHPGDLITHINHKPLKKLTDWSRFSATKNTLLLQIIRQSQRRFVALDPPKT